MISEPTVGSVRASSHPASPEADGLPLDGIRVLDLCRVVAGPVCGALLGDMGADVIKVEDTQGGDESRGWPPIRSGQSAGYLVNNRNKRAIAVDLKSADGVQLVRDLAQRADVVIENFRTGAMERLGLAYEQLAALNSRLIYCSISAFGRTGPRAAKGGYEALMQAFSGIMSMTGEPGEAPVRCGISALDVMTGTPCAFGVVNAVLHRQQTGRGQRVDGSLLDSAMSLLNFQAQGYLISGVVPSALGSAHPSLYPYRNFRCGDGRWIFVAAANDRLWARLTAALGLQALLDDRRFASNPQRVAHRAELESLLEQAFLQRDSDQVYRLLQDADVPTAPVNDLAQVLEDGQMTSRPVMKQMIHPELGKLPVLGMPLSFSRFRPEVRRHSPLQGEHTDELLKEIGRDPAQIASLRQRGIVR